MFRMQRKGERGTSTRKETYARTAARRAAILDATQGGEVSTAELAERFGVTMSTIRRDVAHLAAEGRLSRTYGGVTTPTSTLELDTSHKARQYPVEKRQIAKAAAQRVLPGDVIIIDAGTTTGRLAQAVREVPELTVVTGGMNALLALHDAHAVDLIVIGGRLRHINQGTVGSFSEYGLSFISADRVFLGAEGLDPDLGISCPTLEQATLKSRMIESAREVFVLVDHSKLARRPFNFWARVPEHATVITDAKADADVVSAMGRRWKIEQVGEDHDAAAIENDAG
jgi:DeoR family transcriptional regulator, fructose operon transcriptional repressor